MSHRLTPLLLLCLFALACGGTPQRTEMSYSERAERAFYDAEEALDGGNYNYALSLYRQVRDNYELSSYAVLAELRVADVYFEQGSYRQAAQSYRQFNQLHPTHRAVPYATFRIGMSYFEDMPSNFFLLPPPYERELGSTRSARRTLQDFLTSYADSADPDVQTYIAQAEEALREAQDRLAGYEFYVGEFYLERNRPVAAADHFRTLLDRFPASTREPEAMFLLARCYVDLMDVETALEVLAQLVDTYPEHNLTAEAQAWIGRHSL
jgi:outer membrane protein assembly factor BamD